MSTTTFALLRNGMETAILALTPAKKADLKFKPSLRNVEIRDWALGDTKSTAISRKFQIREDESEVDPPFLHPDERWVTKFILVTVPYFVGAFRDVDGNDDAEDIIDADADLIHDALVDADNYVSGQNGTFIETRAVDRGDDKVWFLDLKFRVHMQKARNS